MSLLEAVPGNYRFTEVDVNSAWELFAADRDKTEDEEEFIHLAHIAEEKERQSKQFPTPLDESVAEHWRREDAYWQKHSGRNAPRTAEPEPDWTALLEKSAERERNAK
jgi:hypothetical protein